MSEQLITLELIGLNNLLRRQFAELGPPPTECELTGLQFWLLGYIYKEGQHRDLFQKDLESAFKIRGSTATGILKLLEQKGYLRRESVPYDARLKKLCITSKALAIQQEATLIASAVEDILTQGLNDTHRKTLFFLLNMLKENLEK